ncbi:MAG: DUF3617 domain-containing protein [Steroidobacteraceae bacterium]
MSKRSLFCLLAFFALASYAGGLGLKPGLYEVKIVKQVVDGRDMTAQIAASAERMQQMMANMTPDQRAQMQAMMPKAGAGLGDNGNFRICISPEFAKRDQPVIDKEGHCQPATVKHDGNVTSYEFSCSSNGGTRQGKGESVSNGDVLTNRVDMTMTQSSGQTRKLHNESEMHYLGPDCGAVKPFDAPK